MNSEVLDLLDKTNKLDLSRIKTRASKDNNWSDDHAADVEKQYRMFFSLMGSNLVDRLSPPTNDIDLFWHTHILYTLDYAKACKNIHGRFLHHIPSDDLTMDEKEHDSKESRKIFCSVFDVQFLPEELDLSQCSEKGCAGHRDDD